MQFKLFLLFFLSSHQLFMITATLFDHNQTNSSLNIKFYQCNTNKTLVNSTIIPTDKIFDSCDLDCCTKNDSNQTSIFNKIII